MTTKQANMKHLMDRRDQLRAEFAAVRARLDEVENLIRVMTGDPVPSSAPTKARRGDLKEIVLGLYDQAAETGLSAAECVAAAQEKRGVTLQAASVSSLLSRLKADGVLMYDGDRYRLKKFAGPRSSVG
jgi:hypothetical protein